MKEIKRLSEQIDEELNDANKYIKFAFKFKEERPALGDLYFELSRAEMDHVTRLHDAVTRIINDYAESNPIPEGMQAVYNYLHEKQIKWASKIRAKQEEYKA